MNIVYDLPKHPIYLRGKVLEARLDIAGEVWWKVRLESETKGFRSDPYPFKEYEFWIPAASCSVDAREDVEGLNSPA